MTDIETHCSLYFDAPDELRDSETNEYDEAAVSVWLKENDYPPIPPYLWFAPEEGLKTITGLLAHLSANPGCIESATDAQDALDRCRETLEELAITHIRWHFEVTF